MTHSIQERLREAQRALDANQFERAAEVLDELIRQRDPEALFLRANFSLRDEDVGSFQERTVRQLHEAEALGHAGAAYQLSICYEEGDLVPRDPSMAAQVLHRAADRGHPHAIWRIGTMLVYGTGGYEQDLERGIAMIRRAAALKSQGALRALATFYAEGSFGFPQDPDEAERLARAAEADDVIAI